MNATPEPRDANDCAPGGGEPSTPGSSTRWRLFELLPAGLLAASCCVLLYGFWSHRAMLAEQPLWSMRDALEVGILVLAYAILCAALYAIRAVPTRVIAGTLLIAYATIVAGLGPLASALLVLLACLAVGDLIVCRLGRDTQLALRALISTLVGLALLAMLVGILAHFPINRPAFYVPLFIVAVVLDKRGIRGYWQGLSLWFSRSRPRDSHWAFLATALLVLVLLLQSVRAVLPETGGDGMGMHLVVASQLASQHQWSFDPAMFAWGVYPLGSEWIEGVGWILGGETAARLLSFAFSLLVVLTIVVVTRRFASPSKSLLTGCLFASAGIAFGLTANVYAEPALAAFVVGAFAVVTLPRSSWTTWNTIALGILCGGCLLTKVTALYLVVPLLVLMVVRLARGGSVRSVLVQTAIALGTVIGVSFFPYAYAFWRTGNPVFPLYNDIFRSSLAPPIREADPRWIGKFSWRLPYRMTFSTSGYCEVYNGTFGFQYLALMPLALVVAALRRNWIAISAFLIALVSGAAMLYSTQYVRYIFPMMALASIPLAAAFQCGEGRGWTWLSRAACTLGVLIVVVNLAFYPGGAWNLPGFQGKALVSDIARQQFVDQQAPERDLTAAVNALDGRMARVAFFGRAFAAGLQGTPLFAMNYNPGFEAAVAQAKTAADVVAVLRARAVSHVIAPLALVEASTPLREALSRDAEMIAERNGVALYRLKL
jgi:hypothetical protein